MSFAVNRIHAYNRQHGRCYYCQWPMWEAKFEPEADALARITIVRSNRRDDRALIKSLRCTAEHVERRTDGGDNRSHNIVAACMDCNTMREAREPANWQTERLEDNQFEQASHDEGFDPIFYAMPNLPITRQYRMKWRQNFFVEVPRWQAEVEAMRLGDFSAVGSRYQTADSIAVIYPLFSCSEDLKRPAEVYRWRQQIEGAQILLESADHRAKLEAVFGSAVVKQK